MTPFLLCASAPSVIVGTPVVGALRLPPPCMCTPAPDPVQPIFNSLLESPGLQADAVQLQRGAFGRSLVASRAIEAGEVLLSVPLSLCLTTHRSGVCGGLIGQTDAMWEAAGDLREEVGESLFKRGATWDVRLALAVLEATAGAGGPFWDAYRQLLPVPPQLAHPVCLPVALQPELQDEELERGTAERAALLSDIYPLLADHAMHPVTASYVQMGAPLDRVPSPLQWAYGLVTSRCFAMADDEDSFAFVPFLDLCQHAADPAADFASGDGAFALRARRDLEAGEELSICYGADYSSRRLFKQYGFVPAEGVAADAALLLELCPTPPPPPPPSADAAAGGAGAAETAEGGVQSGPQSSLQAADLDPLLAAFKEHKGSDLATSERLAAVYDALTADEAPPLDVFREAVVAARVAMPTSLQEDEETLEEMAGGGDPRARAVLEYRVQRKRQLLLAENILDTYATLKSEK